MHNIFFVVVSLAATVRSRRTKILHSQKGALFHSRYAGSNAQSAVEVSHQQSGSQLHSNSTVAPLKLLSLLLSAADYASPPSAFTSVPALRPLGRQRSHVKAAVRIETAEQPGAEVTNIEQILEVEERVQRFTNVQVDYLMPFWSAELQSFQIVPRELERTSLMSTCESLSLILDNKERWRSVAGWESSDTTRVSVSGMIQAILDTPWAGDAFQTPLVVATLASTRSIDKNSPKFVGAVRTLLEQRSYVRLNKQQNISSYLRYKNAEAFISLLQCDMVPNDINVSDITYALDRANKVAFDELSRQLAYFYSGDLGNFDVIVLGCTLMTYYQCSQSLLLGAEKGGVVPYTNMEIVRTALSVIFSQQSPDGTFRKGEPIATSADPRDIGNSYVFLFDFASSLLNLPAELLSPYLSNLERWISYAENNEIREALPDGRMGTSDGRYFKGWKSNHVMTGGVVCWATAAVFKFLEKFEGLLRTVITNDVLREFKGETKEDVLIDTGGRNSWKRLMDADVKLGETTSSLKKELFDRVLLPQLQIEEAISESMLSPYMGGERNLILDGKPEALYELARQTPPQQPLYSAILFGPPGTAKTTIVKNMASTINWNFLTIDTADFLADGLTNIASRMTYLFDRLQNLEKTVILFDEIEEFCLDRENPSCTMESRLMTTAMLTQLNNLRRGQKNIFVVATNRLRSFDAAVIRPGRFDMLLFVGTPNKAARQDRLRGALKKANIPSLDVDKVAGTMGKIWDEEWDELRFATFAENERLMKDILEMLKTGQFTEEILRRQIQSIQRTATIQGQVQQEYIESEMLSRL